MKRLNDYYEFTLSSHWLFPLMYSDESGLTDDESADLTAFMREYSTLEDMTINVVDQESQFAVDAVSGLHADCYTVRFYFTNHALNPQQHALDLN